MGQSALSHIWAREAPSQKCCDLAHNDFRFHRSHSSIARSHKSRSTDLNRIARKRQDTATADSIGVAGMDFLYHTPKKDKPAAAVMIASTEMRDGCAHPAVSV
jgi:hypothetical protein